MQEPNAKNCPLKPSKDKWLGEALAVFARFSAWVVGPVVIGTLLGKWLDDKYGGGQFIFLGTIGAAFIISISGLIIEAGREYGKIEKESKDKDRKNDKKICN